MNSEEEFYKAIGKFVVEFEMISNALEQCIREIFWHEGLSSPGIIDCILSGLTAEPLSSLTQSLYHEHFEPDTEDSRIVDNVFNRFRKLVSKRNDLIHGQHFLMLTEGSSNDGDFVFSQKLHRNKKGAATKQNWLDVKQIDELYDETQELFLDFLKIRDCIESKANMSMNFEIIEGKGYRAKPGEVL